MKRKIMFICLVLTLVSTSCCYGEVVNEIVAVVNDDVVTQQDLNKFFLPLKLQIKSRYSGKKLKENLKKAKQNLLKKMVQDKLLLEEAKKNGFTVNEARVERKLKSIRENFSSKGKFKEYLKKSGMEISDLKDRYRQQFLIDKLVAKKVKSNVTVTPNELIQYYKENKGRFRKPARVKVRQIFLPKEEKDASKKIKKIKKLLNEKASFKQITKKHSQGTNAKKGGLLGVREKGELLHEIDKVIFNLEEGGISDVVETSMGYHIFKVEEKYPPSTRDFKEVRSRLKNILFQKKAQEKFQKYLQKLREDAYVSIKK